MNDSKREALDQLKKELDQLQKDPRWHGSTRAVPGEGSSEAELVFVGEAPGATEDALGRPFVGQAGKLLDQLLAEIGLLRQEAYITNILKFRPPANRDPLPDEIKVCRPYLLRELKIIQPKLVVLLGRHALLSFLPGGKMSELRGLALKRGGLNLFVAYHPAAALYNSALKTTLSDDFHKIPLILKALKEAKVSADSSPLQLFS